MLIIPDSVSKLAPCGHNQPPEARADHVSLSARVRERPHAWVAAKTRSSFSLSSRAIARGYESFSSERPRLVPKTCPPFSQMFSLSRSEGAEFFQGAPGAEGDGGERRVGDCDREPCFGF
jgi:hypothetical protein